MSINAINGISIYEYYYKINRKDQDKSPIAEEMKQYGLTPTDSEALNIELLNKAKQLEKAKEEKTEEKTPNSQRPWADLMYQLNIPFNEDPKDDIDDIKIELASLTRGMNDEELEKEVADLERYVEDLYLNFTKNYSDSFDSSLSLSAQLNNLSMMNRATLL